MAEKIEKKKDIFPALAITAGIAAAGVGLYLYMKKPGLPPGGTIRCHFTFDYVGEGGTYVLQVWFGDNFPGQWFIHVFGCTMQVTLPGPGTYEYDLLCDIPLGTKAQTYDAEALIRTPDMAEFDYLAKDVQDGVIEVIE